MREAHGTRQQDVASNLDYLVQKGWVSEVVQNRSFNTRSGTVQNSERIRLPGILPAAGTPKVITGRLKGSDVLDGLPAIRTESLSACKVEFSASSVEVADKPVFREVRIGICSSMSKLAIWQQLIYGP